MSSAQVSTFPHTRRSLAACLGLSALCLLAPSIGHATTAPAGNSAVQEFVESLPDGSGLRTSNDIADFRGEALASGRVVDERTRRALTGGGRDGRAIVSLAEASGPRPSREAHDPRSIERGESALGAAVKRVAGGSGPGGLGLLLPIVLLAGLLAASGYAFQRGPRT
jgi:hypothetical protein